MKKESTTYCKKSMKKKGQLKRYSNQSSLSSLSKTLLRLQVGLRPQGNRLYQNNHIQNIENKFVSERTLSIESLCFELKDWTLHGKRASIYTEPFNDLREGKRYSKKRLSSALIFKKKLVISDYDHLSSRTASSIKKEEENEHDGLS
jgi:hypothetical protein